MPTRSTKLASIKPGVATYTTLLTVPDGQTYLVKDVGVANNGGVADTIYVQGLDATGVAGPLIWNTSVPANSAIHWQGWVALNPGDKLLVYSLTGNSHFWISGTKLPGIA